MKRIVLLAAVVASAASAQTSTSYGDGDRKAGVTASTPQGQGVIPLMACTDTTNARISCGGGSGGSGGGPATIADGADTAEGTTTDTAYSGTGTGTLVAINKAEVTRLQSILTALGSPFQVGGSIGNTAFALNAGTASIGTVGLNAGTNAIGSITNTTFAATQATAANLNATIVGTGTFATQVTSSALPAGGSTSANQSTQITAEQAILAGQTSGTQRGFLVNSVGTVLGTYNNANDARTPDNSVLLEINAYPRLYDPIGGNFIRGRGDINGAYVVTKGGNGLSTGQVSVGTTATLVAAARTNRQKIGVTVTTAVQCAFGNSGVTLATGWPLAAVAYASDSWDTNAALYAVCASPATVAYREQY